MNPLRAKLWQLGVIAPWFLREDQVPLYRLLHAHKDPFLECGRRYGKTTTILVFVLEKLRQNPGWVARFCEPNKNQAREIVQPAMDRIQHDCPKDYRFEWVTTDSYYRGPGNSRLYLRGVNEDRGDSARGPAANIIVADEFGTWKDPEYIVRSALRPQLQKQAGQHFIYASTPPEDLGHRYYDMKGEAIRDKRFIMRTIYDNKSLSEDELAKECKDAGGADSAAWRREYLCEPVASPERLVIPEYKEDTHDFEELGRPRFFDPYVGADFGFNDNTALLFGYHDFETQTLVIEDEWVASGKNSAEITTAAKEIEARLWQHLLPLKRVGDNEKQQLYDMNTQFGYSVLPTRKDDKIAAINALRIRFAQGRIRVHKRCQSLRFQLKVGLWNERRTDWVRGEKTGHLDAVAALVYLNRNIDTHHNPWPLNQGVEVFSHHIPSHAQTSEEACALEEAFSPFRRSAGS